MKKLILAVLIVLWAIPCMAVDHWRYPPMNVTLPYELTFSDNTWRETDGLYVTECGGTSTHTTTGCYSGGCMKVTPPTSACTGGTGPSANGGGTGIGWFGYTSTNQIHVRFLIKFAADYVAGHTGSVTKFLLFDEPARSGILGLLKSSNYLAFALLQDVTEEYWFTGDTAEARDHYIEATPASRRISATNLTDWIAVEYVVNNSANTSSLYMWTANGDLNGLQFTISSAISTANTGFYISYFNGYGVAGANNYYLMDNLAISTAYIGPPTGFLTGGATPITSTGHLRLLLQ